MEDWKFGQYMRKWVMDSAEIRFGTYLVQVTNWGAITGFYMKRTSTTPPKRWRNKAISNYESWTSTSNL